MEQIMVADNNTSTNIVRNFNRLLICIFILSLSSCGNAANVGSTSGYIVRYSKSDVACNDIKSRLNVFLDKYNELTPLNNPFNDVTWKVSKDYSDTKHSIFNIDNSNDDEVVLNMEFTVDDRYETNGLYIYENIDSVKNFKGVIPSGHIGSISMNGSMYCLDLEKLGIGYTGEISQIKNYCLHSAFTVFPIKHGNQYFIGISDWPSLDRKKWFVVFKYISGDLYYKEKKRDSRSNKVKNEDICYLEKL